MPLCSFSLSPHELSLAKYLTMVLEKIHKIPSPPILRTTYQDYQVYPATALYTWFKIIKQLVAELFFHPLCIRSPLHSNPGRPHRPFLGAPGHRHPQHPRRRPQQGAAPRRRRGRTEPRGAAVFCLRRRRARRRQRLEGSTPWLSTAHPHLSGRNRNQCSDQNQSQPVSP